jgi:hypothetical protein
VSGEKAVAPGSFEDIIRAMIAKMAQLPKNHPDVVSSSDRVCDHLTQEVVVILECERQRKIVATRTEALKPGESK